MLVLGIVFLPFLGAAAAWLLGGRHEKARDAFVPAFAALIFGLCLLLLGQQGGSAGVPGVLDFGLHFTVDGFRTVYALITAFMWLMTSLFSREYFAHEREGLAHYYVFWLMTLGATEGVMLSADLMTTFVFFEILSFTSFTWVLHEQTRKAIRAGYTYLFIAVIGGLLLLMGLLLLYSSVGTLAFAELPAALANASSKASPGRLFAAGVLILLGFGAKAGMFPLHVWLPKAHPVAPSPGSALLSGVLTKVGIFGILMTAMEAFPASGMLGAVIYVLGLVTMVLGALLALFSVNLKRTLACSSMSQVGFILTGLGSFVLQGALAEAESAAGSGTLSVLSAHLEEGRVLAASGLMLHMVNHSLLKLALFMIAGVVVMNLHRLDLNEIRGYGRKKPLLKLAFALGGLGISGVPLFNGYISKTMLHEGIVMLIELAEEKIPANAFVLGCLSASEWVFLVSGGLTFAYMLKLFICIFVEKNSDPAVQAAFDAPAASPADRETSSSPALGGKSGAPAASLGPYMNGLSAFAILGSALFMVLLGQPAVMNRLAAFMTGNGEILEFQAFSLANLKGGFISLGIGALVYLLIVRGLLMGERKGSSAAPQSSRAGFLHPGGPYLDRWPAGLDLEERVYRPLLTRILPGFFGAILRIPAENVISGAICRGLVFLGAFLGRCLATGTDALFALLRSTVLRERRVRTAEDFRPGRLRTALRVTQDALRPVYMNFSFALLMTCVGVLVFLAVLLAAFVG